MDMPVPRKRGFRSVPRRSSFFFFSMEPRLFRFQKGSAQPPASCSIDPCISSRKKNWDLSFDDVQFFFLFPRESAQPAFVNFSRRNNFRRGWNEARTIPRKGIKIQYEFMVGTLTSRSNFSVLLLGRGHAVYRDVQSFDFNLLLKLRPLPPRGHIARASYVYYERIRGPAFRSPAFTLRVAHLCIV